MEANVLTEKICGILKDRKGENVVAINVGEKSSVADYFVIASGRSTTHTRSLVERVEEELEKEDEEKVLYFVIDYNKYAKEINETEGKVVYKLALVAQKWLITDLHWTTMKEKNELIEKHPEKRNPFVKINRRDSSIDASKKIYNNESIRAKFGKKNANKVEEAIAKQLSSHEYDIFENTPQDADEIGNTYMSDPALVLTND